MTNESQFGRMKIDEKEPANPAPGIWMIPGFGNTGLVQTDEGLVMTDMPVRSYLEGTMHMLREITQDPVHTIFLTHGHLDHAIHLDHLFQEAAEKGSPPPKVIAHRNILKRFQKYRMLHGFHEYINRTQFNLAPGQEVFPLPERNPDVVFDQSISLSVGGLDFHAFHEKGETDDHLWVWAPEKKTVFTGDLVTMTVPNIGNPFKVQRYTLEWAEALEAIVAKEPEVLVPAHGPVMTGRDRIREAALKTARYLRYLHGEVVERLNNGMSYEDILHDVRVPAEIMDSDHLRPTYGCTAFVIHGILRQYTGWYDGNPTNLFPPKTSEIQAEVAGLVSKEALMDHARRLKEGGRGSMALQFVDIAQAAPLDAEEKRSMHRLKADILGELGHQDKSFICKSIYYRAREQELKNAGPE